MTTRLGFSMDELAHVKQLIIQLLSTDSFEYGARLKQRLNITLESLGRPAFDQRKYGSKKFSQFLATHLDDRLAFERPDATGDIHVSLKHPAPRAHAVGASSASRPETTATIRSDIWQAFTNPDQQRKRFFHRATGEVVHFLEGMQSEFEQAVQATPQHFAEIDFISAQTHKEWMSEFVEWLNLPEPERAPLDGLIAMEYSSSVNAAFTKALGEREQEWRKIRTLKVTERIKTWATQHHVKHDDLMLHRQVQGGSSSTATPAEPSTPTMTPRQQAARLLEMMSDEDILTVAIPVLLSNVLSKSQI